MRLAARQSIVCCLGGEAVWCALHDGVEGRVCGVDALEASGHDLTIRGDSYRLREKRRAGLLQKAGPAPEPTAS